MPPPDADFAIKIDFERGEGNPRRVFDAAASMVTALQQFDNAISIAIDSDLKPILVLEDIESGSIKIWLKNVLQHANDDALKTLDWKPLVGQYLVKAKYVALRWLDESEKLEDRPSVNELAEQFRKMAEETDVRHLPDYPPIHDARLARSLDGLQDAKQFLNENDKLTIETEDAVYEVDLTSSWHPTEHVETSELQEPVVTSAELVLVIKKPDLIGSSMWEFRHGKTRLVASITDESWLDRFHNREIPVFPGDALRCKVAFSHQFDKSGDLVEQRTEVTEVVGTVEGDGVQGELLDDD